MLLAALNLLGCYGSHTELEKLRVVRDSRVEVPKKTTDLPFVFRNGITELAVLHARILIDILISRGDKPDDISLDKLLPDCDPVGIKALEDAYFYDDDDKRHEKKRGESENTPCWQFNKHLAHATTNRGEGHDYSSALKKVLDPIVRILESIKKKRPCFDLNLPSD